MVDNHSTDGTRKLLQKEEKERDNLRYYRMPGNLGFGEAVNHGFRHALGDFVVILNNDTLVTPGWLEKLIEPFQRDELIGIVSPVTNYVGEGPQIDPDAVEIPVEDIDSYAEKIRNRDHDYEPNRLVFFCVAIRREVIDIVGSLDVGYEKGNYEDDDYCMRTLIAGFKLAIARGSFVYHLGSMTFKKNKISHDEFMERNRKRFYRKAQSISLTLRPPREKTRKPPLVSVVVRTLNRPELLRNALVSLSNQTFGDFEAVVINDGGEDVTNLVHMFERYFPIRYVHNATSRGRTASLNIGVDECRGDWVTFLDDDDIVYPWHLEALYSGAREKPGEYFHYSDYNKSLMRSKSEGVPLLTVGTEPWDFDPKKLLVQNFIPIHAWLVSRTCFRKFGGFDESFAMLEDFEFLMRLSKSVKFHHVKRFTCEYRFYLDGVNSTAIQRAKTVKALESIYKKHPTVDPRIASERKFLLAQFEHQVRKIEQLQTRLASDPDSEMMVYREIINLMTGI